MNTRQIITYARKNGFNSVKFSIKRNGNHFVAGEFLDAYFEFVKIPLLGDGFVTIGQLEAELGHDLEFEVIDEEKYKNWVRLDFLLRGKPLPEKFAFESEDTE
jgi:hypothetical protein